MPSKENQPIGVHRRYTITSPHACRDFSRIPLLSYWYHWRYIYQLRGNLQWISLCPISCSSQYIVCNHTKKHASSSIPFRHSQQQHHFQLHTSGHEDQNLSFIPSARSSCYFQYSEVSPSQVACFSSPRSTTLVAQPFHIFIRSSGRHHGTPHHQATRPSRSTWMSYHVWQA